MDIRWETLHSETKMEETAADFPSCATALLREGKQALVLLADGGFGKTTALLECCRRLLLDPVRADGSQAIPLYIPLSACRQERHGIMGYFSARLSGQVPFASEGERVNYIQNVEQHLLDDARSSFHYVFLLDGANENAGMSRFAGEILRLAAYRNVSVLVSSRSALPELSHWRQAQLHALDMAVVLKSVQGAALEWEELQLLTNPYYLSRYMQLRASDSRLAERFNRYSLLEEYQRWSLEKHRAGGGGELHPGGEFAAAIHTVFPALCFALALGGKRIFSTDDAALAGETASYAGIGKVDLAALCRDVLVPMGLAAPLDERGVEYQLRHENDRDFQAARHLASLLRGRGTSDRLLSAFSGTIPGPVFSLLGGAFPDRTTLRRGADRLNDLAGQEKEQRADRILQRNVVALYALLGGVLEDVDLSDRDLREANFLPFSRLLRVNFRDAAFSPETFQFPSSLLGLDFYPRTIAFPDAHTVVLFDEYSGKSCALDVRERRVIFLHDHVKFCGKADENTLLELYDDKVALFLLPGGARTEKRFFFPTPDIAGQFAETLSTYQISLRKTSIALCQGKLFLADRKSGLLWELDCSGSAGFSVDCFPRPIDCFADCSRPAPSGEGRLYLIASRGRLFRVDVPARDHGGAPAISVWTCDGFRLCDDIRSLWDLLRRDCQNLFQQILHGGWRMRYGFLHSSALFPDGIRPEDLAFWEDGQACLLYRKDSGERALGWYDPGTATLSPCGWDIPASRIETIFRKGDYLYLTSKEGIYRVNRRTGKVYYTASPCLPFARLAMVDDLRFDARTGEGDMVLVLPDRLRIVRDQILWSVCWKSFDILPVASEGRLYFRVKSLAEARLFALDEGGAMRLVQPAHLPEEVSCPCPVCEAPLSNYVDSVSPDCLDAFPHAQFFLEGSTFYQLDKTVMKYRALTSDERAADAIHSALDAYDGETGAIYLLACSGDAFRYGISGEDTVSLDVLTLAGSRFEMRRLFDLPQRPYAAVRFAAGRIVCVRRDGVDLYSLRGELLRTCACDLPGKTYRVHTDGNALWLVGDYSSGTDPLRITQRFARIDLETDPADGLAGVLVGEESGRLCWAGGLIAVEPAAEGDFDTVFSFLQAGGTLRKVPSYRIRRTEDGFGVACMYHGRILEGNLSGFCREYDAGGNLTGIYYPFTHEVTGSIFTGVSGIGEADRAVLRQYGAAEV